ncbi:PASTA domain-containing protein [Candidatus Babeliales bacterium]|nr:PASTA domain-containing protein [Candidatus Babeliales bacterium]
MKIFKQLSYYIWALPFIFFVLGYTVAYFFMQQKTVEVPSVMGSNVQEAVSVLARQQLALRLLAEKEDDQFPEGTILQQAPAAYQRVRPNQQIFVTIAKKPPQSLAPDLLNKDSLALERQAAQAKVTIKQVLLASRYPKNACFAQSVSPGQPLDRLKMTAYISAGDDELVLMPNVVGLTLVSVQEFFKRSNIDVQVVGQDAQPVVQEQLKIVEQKPMAGTIVDLTKLKQVHVQVCYS